MISDVHTPEYINEIDRNENFLRPQNLKEFKGQSHLKENLSIFIQSAKQRELALDHVFLIGPPGLGKTTLATIIANEMQTEIKLTSAPALDKPKDLAGILTNISEGSVFFIDEIHRLKPALEEMLYIAMEDFEIDWVIGQGPSARSIRVPIPHFTLIGATTKAGNVSSPLHTRFGINCRIEFYSIQELSEIVKRSADILECPITKEAIRAIATCSRGTPRIANRLLRRIYDFAIVLGNGTITEDIVYMGLDRLKIDKSGLEKMDREILRIIIENYRGGPVGAETLSISVGEAVESLEDYYEPYLIREGYLQRTPRGRVVTDKAYELLNLKKENYENQGILF